MEFDITEISGQMQSQHAAVTHPFGNHARQCLTLAVESECSCSAPLTPEVGFIPEIKMQQG